MDPRADLVALPDLLAETARLATAFREGLADRPVIAPIPYRPEGLLPERGPGAAAVLAEVGARVLPALSGSAGPRYLGFVTGGSTPAALAGDLLVAAADQNLSDGSQATATALEHHTLAMLRELFGLPPAFEGAFVTGATQANLVGLAVGRQWASERLGFDAAEDGLSGFPHPDPRSRAPREPAQGRVRPGHGAEGLGTRGLRAGHGAHGSWRAGDGAPRSRRPAGHCGRQRRHGDDDGLRRSGPGGGSL